MGGRSELGVSLAAVGAGRLRRDHADGTEPMKVVLVSNTIPPDKMGGLPRYVRELGTALAKAGCETIVLAKRADSEAPRIEDAPDGVRIIRHSVPSKRNPFFAPAYPFYSAYGVLAPLQGAQGPDTIVHAHFPVTAL